MSLWTLVKLVAALVVLAIMGFSGMLAYHVAVAPLGGVFERIVRTTAELVMGIEAAAAEYDVPVQAGFAGTMFGVYFLKSPGAVISDYASAKENADSQRYAHVFHAMLDRGVYLAPSQFEAGFMSSTHGNLEIDITLAAIHDVFDGLNEAAAS